MCKNVTSQVKIDLLGIKDEIINAIKENGACGGCDERRDLPHSEE
jgi:hypothetical protein